MIKTGIVGATGYTGVELVRILASHPEVEIEMVTSRSETGRPVSEVFQSLRGSIDINFCEPDETKLAECDVVFFATPNGTAMQFVPGLLDSQTRIIDLSADFRLKDKDTWQQWYGMEHECPQLLKEAVYGLPEVNRDEIADARLVANPGCYPTAIQLGFIPLIINGLVDTTSLIADAKSGVSGAGRNQSIRYQYSEVSESFSAYAASGHRHLPEINQGLQGMTKEDIELVFIPHLVPMIRGIHATLYATLKDKNTDLHSVFTEYYKNEAFVDVMPPGAHPDTGSVRGSNMVRVACHQPQNGQTAVILVVEDNLVKGAAGQAVQNMNIMFGFDEKTGLNVTPCFP